VSGPLSRHHDRRTATWGLPQSPEASLLVMDSPMIRKLHLRFGSTNSIGSA
jgi:hypothetical protein